MTAVQFERVLRWFSAGLEGLLVLFCLTPAILVIVLSFFGDVFINFPPREPTLRLYRELFTNAAWGQAAWISVKVSVPAAIVAVALATPAVIAIDRARLRGAAGLDLLALVPLLIPATGYAIALYVVYLRLDWVGRYLPLALAEAIVAVPVAFLIIRGALRRIGDDLEIVAMSLGASRMRAIFSTTLRLLLPAIAAGLVFAFLASFDDALYVTFLGGPHLTTVSKAILDSLRFSVDPLVAPLSALLMIVTATVVTFGILSRGPRGN